MLLRKDHKRRRSARWSLDRYGWTLALTVTRNVRSSAARSALSAPRFQSRGRGGHRRHRHADEEDAKCVAVRCLVLLVCQSRRALFVGLRAGPAFGTPAILSGGVAQPAMQTKAAMVKENRFIVPPKKTNPLPKLLSLAPMASRQTRIRQQNANEALCQPVSGDTSVDLRSYFAAASAVLLSGCAADYLNNYDTMTLASGDANNTNSLSQTVASGP
ncbi:hypothetical protein P9272_28535 [Mesorhizobium sp. WSM4976]|uniref:hypothetical protein n=1 Tax=Mesorhizobium sp. WSM4976 TaxID=3038549 RepID=UPI0024169AC6|nr:hypothetical protein [Mesorhizobium sp. WSM4976]MDG4897499.1 hypothetical protein [Mesorhizobium sp. WSM4976]